MTDALTNATFEISEEELRWMVLNREHLPEELRDFEIFREGILDNATMAEQGFPGHTADSFSRLGRITGYMREFGTPKERFLSGDGTELVAATVAHLFRDDKAVHRWMEDVFVKRFEEHVGMKTDDGHEIVTGEKISVAGFHDEAVGMWALQRGPNGHVSSTVIDFRVGRILGVAYLVVSGKSKRESLVESMAAELERQIVRVVLGSA